MWTRGRPKQRLNGQSSDLGWQEEYPGAGAANGPVGFTKPPSHIFNYIGDVGQKHDFWAPTGAPWPTPGARSGHGGWRFRDVAQVPGSIYIIDWHQVALKS